MIKTNLSFKNIFSFILFSIIAFPVSMMGQGQVALTLNEKMSVKQANNISVLNEVTATMSTNKYANLIEASLLEQSTFFEIDRASIKLIRKNNVDLMTVPVEIPGFGALNLGVYRQNIFTPDLLVQNSEGELASKIAHKIMFFRGAVMGIPNSLVSLTISDDEVSGMISIGSDNFNLGKIKGISTHILYNDKDSDLPHDFVCDTPEPVLDTEIKPIGNINTNKTIQCVRLRVEVDNGLMNQLGGFIPSVNYVASLYNEVFTLYANDNISVNISEIFVWQVTSPYSGTSGDILGQMSNTSPNSDLTTLLSTQGSGGIAWLGGLCSPNNAVNFNSIDGFHSNVPTYSWDVEVVAHEMGHNLDSPHTHACAWNGNNTAIDGCGPDAGYSEGCTGSLPAGGGTIMSYCHLTAVGIDFTLGFGPQPSQRIRNYVDASNCLGTVCEAVDPTCDDGIQNGEETEVDCGGPDCAACPTCDDGILNGGEVETDCGGPDCTPCPCFGETLNLAITFDNYAGETSWQITNDIGAVVISGDLYDAQATGSTLNIPFCLNDGCYDLTFFDTFGDGICCAFGNGSYILTGENGTVYASGGDFTSSETTNFCAANPNGTVTLNLKTFLEGPYQDVTGLMSDNLRSNGHLPLNEPYTALGYTLPSTSTSIVVLGQTGNDAIVDWVLVELRGSADPTVVIEKQAALLQRDGDIVSVDGISPIEMSFGSETDVYVALRHRNHLGIRTASSYSTAAPIALEFSNPLTSLFGSNGVKDIGGVNVMISGDANSDGTVNSIDKNSYWRVQNGELYDYSVFRGDFNLDGTVNTVDKNSIWRVNNSLQEQLD